MNTNPIIQDYGKTVDPEVYMRALQGHPYIPQSDECIKRVIEEHPKAYKRKKVILDVGCGPGRLTFDLAKNKGHHVVGIDVSPSFILYANSQLKITKDSNFPIFHERDFGLEAFPGYAFGMADAVLMQGVMHHLHEEGRKRTLQRCHDALKNNGILIIGDEFIRDYDSEEKRVINVCSFYLHIIDEARKGGFTELAEEEVKNLIDDCFSDTEYAGLRTSFAFKIIYEYAYVINKMFYEGGYRGLRNEAYNQIQNLFRAIKESIDRNDQNEAPSFNRGDYKVSVEKFTEEVCSYDFVVDQEYNFGPVDQLGGMGVIVFRKL
jgi:SAM-dependent methyltransferase